jgi:arylsulfatase
VLAEFELAQDTTVAFISDHGEMLGEHELFRTGPYEGSARIPFLLAGPGIGKGAAGTR